MPNDHQSTDRVCPVAYKISGAMYSNVPQMLPEVSILSNILAIPKSVRAKYPSESRRMFSGLRSLCATLLECKNPRANTIYIT